MVRKNWIPQEIRQEGLQAILDRLGPAGTIRFLQQYEPGRVNYVKERWQRLGDVILDEAGNAGSPVRKIRVELHGWSQM